MSPPPQGQAKTLRTQRLLLSQGKSSKKNIQKEPVIKNVTHLKVRQEPSEPNVQYQGKDLKISKRTCLKNVTHLTARQEPSEPNVSLIFKAKLQNIQADLFRRTSPPLKVPRKLQNIQGSSKAGSKPQSPHVSYRPKGTLRNGQADLSSGPRTCEAQTSPVKR